MTTGEESSFNIAHGAIPVICSLLILPTEPSDLPGLRKLGMDGSAVCWAGKGQRTSVQCSTQDARSRKILPEHSLLNLPLMSCI